MGVFRSYSMTCDIGKSERPMPAKSPTMNDLPARASMLAVAEQYEKIAERTLDRLKAQTISRSLPVKSA
jgi:hypothetical protein